MARSPYTQKWRDAVRSGAQSSAAALVPTLVDEFHPTTVIDVGCGEGWFVKAFENGDVQATGVDGSWVDGAGHVDLTKPPYPDLGPYDLALCLEVAEHVHKAHAAALVEWLTRSAPLVVFSAAIPGQGGTGHVNEQWPAFWSDLFALNGYGCDDRLRWQVWDDDRICPWYRQNLFTARAGAAHSTPRPVVHPAMWQYKGHR